MLDGLSDGDKSRSPRWFESERSFARDREFWDEACCSGGRRRGGGGGRKEGFVRESGGAVRVRRGLSNDGVESRGGGRREGGG